MANPVFRDHEQWSVGQLSRHSGKKEQHSNVLLGFVDEEIADHNAKDVDFTTSKIGGQPVSFVNCCIPMNTPNFYTTVVYLYCHYRHKYIISLQNWINLPPPNLDTNCTLCGNASFLITQVYAPLEDSIYDRTLYIFACVQPACWNQAER